jgi:hypothetical protein
MADLVVTAANTGVYPGWEESGLQHPSPILEWNPHTKRYDVASWRRYEHFCSKMGVQCDYNLAWGWGKCWNVYQCTPDDPLHQWKLGICVHLMGALVDKIMLTLRPKWGTLRGRWIIDTADMQSIGKELAHRLSRSALCLGGLGPFAAAAYLRVITAVENKQGEDKKAHKWQVTGNELEIIFLLTPMCLPGLLDEYLVKLNDVREEGCVPVVDFMPQVIYSNIIICI